MDLKQIIAKRTSLKIGKRLINEHPEIAEMYRIGYTIKKISKKLGIEKSYGLTEKVAKNSISVALNGFKGSKGYSAFSGLMSKKEVSEIATQNRSARIEYTKKNEMGIFGLSTEERKEADHKAGTNSAISRGFTPWIPPEDHGHYMNMSEIEFAVRASNVYRKSMKPDNIKIAKILNEIYHRGEEIRNSNAVARAKTRYFTTNKFDHHKPK